jgi:hypothetical protein
MLQSSVARSIQNIKEPWWKVWAIRRKREIFGLITTLTSEEAGKTRIWVGSGLGAQCVCGLVDSLQGPGRPYAIEALRQIGPASIEAIAATLHDDDDTTRERLTSALKLSAYEQMAGKSKYKSAPAR